MTTLLFFISVSFAFGCAGRNVMDANTLGWIRVETEDLVIHTDVDRKEAVKLAKRYQQIRSAIAENEFPCAFERSNAPMEFVMVKDAKDIEALGRRYQAGLTVRSPSARLDAKTQLVMNHRDAAEGTQLFVHELTHGAVALCFPGGRPWLHEGMASFYETARVEEGELVLGMPAFGFVPMTNVEPMHDIYPVYVNRTVVWMLPTRLAPDFDELRSMDAERFYAFGDRRSVSDLRQTTANYAGSWHAVHLLQFGSERLSSLFRTYLTRLARGEDDDHAWKSAFAGSNVAARYQGYLGDDYKIGRIPVETHVPREPTIHAMSQIDVALLRARLYGWSSSEDSETALQYLEFAASKEPDSAEVMLHLAAFNSDTGHEVEGEQWLERALESAPSDPEVLATAILWFSRNNAPNSRREELDAWAEALALSAQTAFQLAELGEHALRTAEDPKMALRHFDKSLALDATRWRTYALAGRAFEDLGQFEKAARAYYTAIALTGHGSSELRSALKRRVERLEGR